jgi:hypothetical protein
MIKKTTLFQDPWIFRILFNFYPAVGGSGVNIFVLIYAISMASTICWKI